MKIFYIIILFFNFPEILISQTQNLKNILWQQAKPCFEMFEEIDRKGIKEGLTIVDDSQNGYLHISGEYPTCGCECNYTIGAYKKSNGKYAIVEYSKWTCSWKHHFSADENVSNLLPQNFSIKEFIPNFKKDLEIKNAIFYLSVDIPRKGTDTKIELEFIPFGIYINSYEPIVYSVAESGNNVTIKPLYYVTNIVSNLKYVETIDYILQNEFDKISVYDKEIIDKELKNDNFEIKSYSILNLYFQYFYKIFQLYSSIENKTIILSWSVKDNRFYIKQKLNKPDKITFKEFLVNSIYWSPIC